MRFLAVVIIVFGLGVGLLAAGGAVVACAMGGNSCSGGTLVLGLGAGLIVGGSFYVVGRMVWLSGAEAAAERRAQLDDRESRHTRN